jgi:4-amino-4-deoxy-L-arabinose transferase-like glycosyltransferase
MSLAFLLYSRTSETVLLLRDPATYVNTAVHIARSGSSLIEDPLYYSLGNELQKALATDLIYGRVTDSEGNLSGGIPVEYRLIGFPTDAELNKTTPQFFNLFPIWLAIGYSMFGMPGIFLVTPLFGTLSVLLIFLVGRRLFGSVAGASAAALLVVNLAHFWYARTPASEVMFQMTFLIAILFWASFSNTKNKLYGVFAGVGFGSLTLIRIDSVLVGVGISGFFLYLIAARRIQRRYFFFLFPLAAIATLGLLDALYSSRPYISYTYLLSGGKTEALGVLLLLVAMATLFAGFPRLGFGSLLRWLEFNHAANARLALAFGFVGLAIFAYFVRPGIQETFSVDFAGRVIPKYAEESFVRLGWYLSPLGIALATVGGAIAISRSANRELTLFLLTSLVFTCYVLVDPRISPDHFWAARRYVPITVPFSLLCIGLVVQRLGWGHITPWSLSARTGNHSTPSSKANITGTVDNPPVVAVLRRLFFRWLGSQVHPQVLAVGLLVVISAFSVHQIWGFVLYREQEGSIAAVEQVATVFPKDAIIVFENSPLGIALAPPLKFIHGLEVFVLGPSGYLDSQTTLCGEDSPYPSADDPRSCILYKLGAASNSRPLFWVSMDTSKQPTIVRERYTKLDNYKIRVVVPMLEQPTTRLPSSSNITRVVLTGDVHQLSTTTTIPPPS